MAEKSSLQVLDLNFDNLKDGLKTYLKSRADFLDYDFEGSAISLLLDVLAYNTYQNNFYTSMVANEMFLDSAQLRSSVVSRAKALGYTPRSVTGSKTTLQLDFSGVDVFRFSIPKDSLQFTASVDGRDYVWTNTKSYEVKNSNQTWSVQVELVEGDIFTQEWTYSSNQNQRFIIPNENVDTSSIFVEIQNSESDTRLVKYNRATDILEMNSDSAIFWLQEVDEENFEIVFGDDIIGKSPINNNIVRVIYRISSGEVTNGVEEFAGPSTINGYSYTTTVVSVADGGKDIESIDDIKFSAPKNYEIQNRAVISRDYERLIKQNFPFVGTVKVWGGEENEPPVYGKVFISGKPNIGFTLGSLQKNNIVGFLQRHNMMTAGIEFMDPTFLYVSPQIRVLWDSNKTSLSENQVRDNIITAIESFAVNSFDRFDKTVIYHSRFTDLIDETDVAVLSNQTTFLLQKRFSPNFNTSTKYIIFFRNKLRATNLDGSATINSTAFTYQGKQTFLEDDAAGNLRGYYYDLEKTYFARTFGTVDYETGMVILDSFAPTGAPEDEIRITAIPYDLDIQTNKYQLMTLTDYNITMIDNAENIPTSSTTVPTLTSVTYVREQLTGVIV